MTTPNPKANFYFEKEKKFKKEIDALRMIVLECGLQEDVKWGCPCYTQDGGNVVLIHAFKDYCAFLFFKGALMKDPKKILVQQTENVQSARQIRFKEGQDILGQKKILQDHYHKKELLQKELNTYVFQTQMSLFL